MQIPVITVTMMDENDERIRKDRGTTSIKDEIGKQIIGIHVIAITESLVKKQGIKMPTHIGYTQ